MRLKFSSVSALAVGVTFQVEFKHHWCHVSSRKESSQSKDYLQEYLVSYLVGSSCNKGLAVCSL